MVRPKKLKSEAKSEAKPEANTIKEDLISNLPDPVLCHILSFLPTRSAVATGILSRRWRHVWKDLQVFDIYGRPFMAPAQEAKFIAYVDAILAQRNPLPIKSFRLCCGLTDDESLEMWVHACVGPHLRTLYLDVTLSCLELFLPKDVFTCKSLVSFVLKCEFILDSLPYKVCLPSLKNMELDLTDVDCDHLLSGCPVLRTLNVRLSNPFQKKWVELHRIRMPRTLRRLIFQESRPSHNDIGHLEINTPYLEYLHLKIQTPCLRFVVGKFPKIMEAHLDIFQCVELEHDVGWVAKLLKALCKTKFLALKYCTTQCLFQAAALELPKFHSLLHLELDVLSFNFNFVMNMLHNCHMLQVFALHNRKRYYSHPLEYAGPAPPTGVPNCVTSHLKTFKFRGYEDTADEHELTAYLLERGLVLETATIHPTSDFELLTKYYILKGLSALPRGSNICQIKFDSLD